MDEKTIEEYKAAENELKKQLEAVKAENMRLEQELKYKDKATGLWNRKYAEKIIEEGSIGADSPDFAVVFTDIDNLNIEIEKAGVTIDDTLLKIMASDLQKSFGEKAVCCKYAGTKMCVFLNEPAGALEEKLRTFDGLIAQLQSSNDFVTVTYGCARHSEHPDMDANALLKEAEYSMQVLKAEKEDKSAAVSAPKPKKTNPGEITILMIDDSLFNLRAIQTMLKDTYKLIMANGGLEGYEIAKAKRPDLILLDYNMPLVDGERTLQLLKSSNLTSEIPVIFISGVSDKEKILKVANLKPAGYLLKPVEKENLLYTINSVLNI